MASEGTHDPLIDLANLLRLPKGKGIEARSAILDGSNRVDIIRGRDFVRWMKANFDTVNHQIVKGKSPEEAAPVLAGLLLRRRFLIRCERRFKKPPPGMDRLAKFPKKVLSVGGIEGMHFSESDFYAWTYDRPMSTMTYVLAGLGALAVVLICLFPVAPMWVKAGVVYIASGLLAAIMAVLILRSVIALASYVGTGRTVWILPNVLADDKPLSELFNPLVAVQEPPARDSTLAWAKQLGVRLVVGGLAAAFVMVLLRNAPDRDTVRREAGRYRDELFDLLKVNDRKLLSQGKNETKGSAAGNDSVPPPAQGGGEEGNDQREEEL